MPDTDDPRDVARRRAFAEASLEPGMRRWAVAGLVAVAVAAAVAWLTLSRGLGIGDDGLAAAVVAHWYDEPDAWAAPAATVDDAALRDVLGRVATIDRARLPPVGYARRCRVAGRTVAHLVVRGQSGPVMVLLIRDRRLAAALPLELPAERLRGRLFAHGDGSIAVLGRAGESIDLLEQTLAAAVEWGP